MRSYDGDDWEYSTRFDVPGAVSFWVYQDLLYGLC